MKITTFSTDYIHSNCYYEYRLDVVIDGDTYGASMRIGEGVPRQVVIQNLSHTIASEVAKKLQLMLA